MFTIRPYRPEDAMGCGECFYEGFFSCPIDANDRAFLRDYGQVLVEKCNFTYVAVTREQQVVGFISGKYSNGFSKALASRCDTARHYGAWVRMFLKFYLRGYKLSAAFQKQFEAFFQQARERDNRDFRDCDLELVALSSKRDFRKGLGTALVARFMERARADGADSVRLMTNTLASWEFYEKRGFAKVSERPFADGSGQKTIVYEYRAKEKNQ